MNGEFYEKSLQWLDDNYVRARKLVFDGDDEIAMFFYQQCDPVIDFLWKTGIVDYECYCELRNTHHNLFNTIFLS